MSSIVLGRCNDCSLNADTSTYGYYLWVGNCNCGNQEPAYNYNTNNFDYPVDCRCDVVINNRKTRYECSQVADISDCLDYITYCTTNTYIGSDQTGLNNFCNAMEPYANKFIKLGDTDQYISDGNILWNLQYQASRCGSARTNLFDKYGYGFPTDQQPNCLPYSENVMINNINTISNALNETCPSGNTLMYNNACTNERCESNNNCCIDRSNCENTALGCTGYNNICATNDTTTPRCPNPCATIIDLPDYGLDRSEGDTWDQDICEFFCPTYERQRFWFIDNNDANNNEDISNDSNIGTIGKVEDRVCSEEYYMLCRLAGCMPASDCRIIWGDEVGKSSKAYPFLHPTVYNK